MEHTCQQISTKANRTRGFLGRDLAACPRDVKESAYKGIGIINFEKHFVNFIADSVNWFQNSRSD